MARQYRHKKDMLADDVNFCEPILASQLPSRIRRWTSEQLLMAAVLYDVVIILARPEGGREQDRLVKEATYWLMSDDNTYVHSFSNICDELGLNLLKTRRKILSNRARITKHLLHSRGNDNFRKINS